MLYKSGHIVKNTVNYLIVHNSQHDKAQINWLPSISNKYTSSSYQSSFVYLCYRLISYP